MAKALRKKHPEDKLHVLVAKRNSGSFTYDGIERGGERVCFEIGEEIEKLARDGQVVTKISVVGYSLGGLVARYTVGLLESRGFFENVKPVVSESRHQSHTERRASDLMLCSTWRILLKVQRRSSLFTPYFSWPARSHWPMNITFDGLCDFTHC